KASTTHLARRLTSCIDQLVPGARSVMKWLRDVTCFCLDEMGQGVTWITPAGFPVVVEEYQERRRRVTFQFFLDGANGTAKQEIRGEYWIKIKREDFGLDRIEQNAKIAPNFVHSLDAAHMMLTINRLQREGLHHFAVVHDSYGVHAPDVPKMIAV